MRLNEKFRVFDHIVFDKLKAIAIGREHKKCVQDIEKAKIIPDASYYSMVLNASSLYWKEREAFRLKWFDVSLETLKAAKLIFADPDNGVLNPKRKVSSKMAEKYVTTRELETYYNYGHDVVYYCHKGRRSEKEWNDKKNEMNYLSGVNIRVLTFHRGTQRSYIFLIRKQNIKRYDKLLKAFINGPWGQGDNPAFTLDSANGGIVSTNFDDVSMISFPKIYMYDYGFSIILLNGDNLKCLHQK